MFYNIKKKSIFHLGIVFGFSIITVYASDNPTLLKDEAPSTQRPHQSQTVETNLNLQEKVYGTDFGVLPWDIWCNILDLAGVTELISLQRVSKGLYQGIKTTKHLYLPEEEQERNNLALSVLLGEYSFSSLFKRGMLTPNGLEWVASYPGFFTCHFKSVYPFNIENPSETDKSTLKSYTKAFQLVGSKTTSGKEEHEYKVVSGFKPLMVINPQMKVKNPHRRSGYYVALMNSLQEDDQEFYPPCRFISSLHADTANPQQLKPDLWVAMMPALIFVFDHFQKDITICEMQSLKCCIKMMEMASSFAQHIEPRIASKWNVGIVKILESLKGNAKLYDLQSHVDTFLKQRSPDSFDFKPFLNGLYARPYWATIEAYGGLSWRIPKWHEQRSAQRALKNLPEKNAIPPKSQFTQEREEQDKAHEEALRKDQEKSHIVQTYPAVIQAQEEKYEGLNDQVRQKTWERRQLQYDLQKNPQKQQEIDALTAEISTLTDEMKSISISIDERKAKLEEAQKKQ